jgi:hypothetical protein
VTVMVNPRLIFLQFAVLGVLSADVKYTLRCEIESSNKVMVKPGALEDAMKNCTSTILQTADKQLTRTGKTTQIVEFANETVITIDHEKKTWSRNGTQAAEQAAHASLNQLKQMGAVFKLTSNPVIEAQKIAGYDAKGLISILEMTFSIPGMPTGMSSRAQMEFWVSDTAPGAKEIMAWAAKSKTADGLQVSPTMRMMSQFLSTVPGGNQVLKDGQHLVGQLVQMSMTMETKGLEEGVKMKMTMKAEGFDTTPIAASEFAIPDGYQEVK